MEPKGQKRRKQSYCWGPEQWSAPVTDLYLYPGTLPELYCLVKYEIMLACCCEGMPPLTCLDLDPPELVLCLVGTPPAPDEGRACTCTCISICSPPSSSSSSSSSPVRSTQQTFGAAAPPAKESQRASKVWTRATASTKLMVGAAAAVALLQSGSLLADRGGANILSALTTASSFVAAAAAAAATGSGEADRLSSAQPLPPEAPRQAGSGRPSAPLVDGRVTSPSARARFAGWRGGRVAEEGSCTRSTST